MRAPRLPWPGRRRRRRIVALVAFRDEMRFLPGLFENLAGQVDGVIGLDDQSSDESRAYVESQPLTLDVLVVPPGEQGELEDGKNHRALTEAAWSHGAGWLLGVDADERVERDFRRRAEAEMAAAEAAGKSALWVPFRELWGAPDRVRMDGIWAEKRKACLFAADRDHRFDERRVHAVWASVPPPPGDYPVADLRLYHLRMIAAEDRVARMDRYHRLDPNRAIQPIGYDYLVDERDIRLDPIEPGREYAPPPHPPPPARNAFDLK